jgi:hypothetical protein
MSDTENQPTAPADNVAQPGPHPHESSDFADWRGTDETGVKTRGLPEGVEPYQAPEPEPEQTA